MNIVQQETIWFPGIYGGRTDSEYTMIVADSSLTEIIDLVQKRAKEDGEWAIENGFVGENEDKMRRMMAWVSEPRNIKQCIEHIWVDEMQEKRTVDFVCRDLANASKWSVK